MSKQKKITTKTRANENVESDKKRKKTGNKKEQ